MFSQQVAVMHSLPIIQIVSYKIVGNSHLQCMLTVSVLSLVAEYISVIAIRRGLY